MRRIAAAVLAAGATIAATCASAQAAGSVAPEPAYRLDQLVHLDDRGEQYIRVVGYYAAEDAEPTRLPDGRMSFRAIDYYRNEIDLTDFPYADKLETNARISTYVVDCYKRTISQKDIGLYTSGWYREPYLFNEWLSWGATDEERASLVRYACDADFRRALPNTEEKLARDRILSAVTARTAAESAARVIEETGKRAAATR